MCVCVCVCVAHHVDLASATHSLGTRRGRRRAARGYEDTRTTPSYLSPSHPLTSEPLTQNHPPHPACDGAPSPAVSPAQHTSSRPCCAPQPPAPRPPPTRARRRRTRRARRRLCGWSRATTRRSCRCCSRSACTTSAGRRSARRSASSSGSTRRRHCAAVSHCRRSRRAAARIGVAPRVRPWQHCADRRCRPSDAQQDPLHSRGPGLLFHRYVFHTSS